MYTEQTINDVLGYIARACRSTYTMEEFQDHRIIREYALEHGADTQNVEEVVQKAIDRYRIISQDKDKLQEHYRQLIDIKKDYGCSTCDTEG